MNKFDKLHKRYVNWMYNHIAVKYFLEYFWALIVSTISAFVFALAIKIFILPQAILAENGSHIVTGGASGFSQVLCLVFEILLKGKFDSNKMYSVFYFIVNIPLLLASWFKIGKRFTILTFINVLEASLFMSLFESASPKWIDDIAKIVNENGGLLARVMFGGVFVGLSSALPYTCDFSAGGIDVAVYIISQKKNNQVGKYSVIVNTIIISLFTLLSFYSQEDSEAIESIAIVPYCILYLFVVSLVVDAIHIRNKKCEVKIVTEDKDLSDILLARIPHGATLTTGSGAFTGTTKIIISMVVSSNEVNEIIKVIKQADPKAFIEIFELHQVFGSFYSKPIK